MVLTQGRGEGGPKVTGLGDSGGRGTRAQGYGYVVTEGSAEDSTVID